MIPFLISSKARLTSSLLLMSVWVAGCRWADLPAVDADTAARAAKLRMQLTGDSAHQYTPGEEPSAQQPAEDDLGDANSRNAVSEVQRLRYMIDSINAATAVLPKVRQATNLLPHFWIAAIQQCSKTGWSNGTCICCVPQHQHVSEQALTNTKNRAC